MSLPFGHIMRILLTQIPRAELEPEPEFKTADIVAVFICQTKSHLNERNKLVTIAPSA